MKIVHVPFTFPPDSFGGTEVYVSALAHAQKRIGYEVVIAAPGNITAIYEHEDIRVRRYEVGAPVDLADLYGEGDLVALGEFDQIMADEQPDVVHFHALTRGVSLRNIRAARSRGIACVFTYHTPTMSCMNGTLITAGGDVCDGRLDIALCTECTLRSKGTPAGISKVLTYTPRAVRGLAATMIPYRRAQTALRMRDVVPLRQDVFVKAMQVVDRIVALNEWTREVLLTNSIPAEKIVLCRHGIDAKSVHGRRTAIRDAAVQLGFFGRLDRTKGLDVVLRALQLMPQLTLELHIYGLPQRDDASNYASTLRRSSESDQRIVWHDPIPPSRTVEVMTRLDAVVVPSQWLETGPLVILEAFAAGTPVIGSDLGGIREMVRHEGNGLLIPRRDPHAWASVFRRICEDGSLLRRMREGVLPVRSAADVADDMSRVYEAILARSTAAAAGAH